MSKGCSSKGALVGLKLTALTNGRVLACHGTTGGHAWPILLSSLVKQCGSTWSWQRIFASHTEQSLLWNYISTAIADLLAARSTGVYQHFIFGRTSTLVSCLNFMMLQG